jgi:hypothetical protein
LRQDQQRITVKKTTKTEPRNTMSGSDSTPEFYKVFFTSPESVPDVCAALADELKATAFVKTPDSLEHFPVFEATAGAHKLSLKRIENRPERGVYRLNSTTTEWVDGESSGTDLSDGVVDKLYSAGFESVMNSQQHEQQFQATQKFQSTRNFKL